MNISSLLNRNNIELKNDTNNYKNSHNYSNICNKIKNIALMSFFIFSIESIPKTDAGPIAYVSCVLACQASITLASGRALAVGAVGACLAGCAALFEL